MSKYSLFLLVFFLFVSCQKREYNLLGTELLVTVAHHGVIVPHSSVYVKIDAQEFPGRDASDYDLITFTNENSEATFDNLLPGPIYLYAEGFDGLDSVSGYIPFLIDENMLGRLVQVEIPVSE